MRFPALLSLVMVLPCVSTSNAQITFNFTAAGGTPANVIAGFNEAAAFWTSVLNDNVTVNVDIDFANTNPFVLAETTPIGGNEPYASFRSSLSNDAISADDFSAAGSLQSGSSYNVLINLTSENGGSTTPYLTSQTEVQLTQANAKAVGLPGVDPLGTTSDGTISFNPGAAWDFDRSDGIAPGQYDFVGSAAHELGHVMGFLSQVDAIDNFGAIFPLPENLYPSFSLDMFRYSDASLLQGAGVEDMTASLTDKIFSIDGGVTELGQFSTGVNFGDGLQASHWRDGLGYGIMGPTATPGVLLEITELDLRAFDVIGWDRFSPVPEPGAMSFLMFCVAGLGLRRSRR